MKTVAIGDVHGRTMWKKIVHSESDADRVVFVGDYFDSFNIPGLDQLQNFNEIIEYKKTSSTEVVLLIGNHDYHYFPEIHGFFHCAGYQRALAYDIGFAINENRDLLQVAYQSEDGFLYSHAGVSSIFMDSLFALWSHDRIAELLNEQFRYKPRTLNFVDDIPYANWYGDDPEQGPMWIRPKSLMKANKNTLKNKVVQVVGHTQQVKIPSVHSTGGRYWFIDTQESSKEYIVIEDGKVTIKKIEE